MAVTMTHQHISTGMPYSDPDYIRRKSKQDLQSHQFPEAENTVTNVQSIPKTDSKFHFLKS